jgi:type III pantothenate kinase
VANVVGAASLFPKQNCLITDAGTCIKFDFINAKKQYLGGAISPGISMRFKALHHYTDKLPLIKPQKKVMLIGNSTKNSIASGVQNGALAEIENIILRYKKKFGGIKVILTGGDMEPFARNIKSDIFAAPHLTLIGLNEILNFNSATEKQ